MNDKNEFRVQWQPLVEMIIVLVTILGSTIPLYLHTSSQIDAIHAEIRDFHGRIEKIDSDFKNHLIYLHQEKIMEKK
jgi:hypothetical protein